MQNIKPVSHYSKRPSATETKVWEIWTETVDVEEGDEVTLIEIQVCESFRIFSIFLCTFVLKHQIFTQVLTVDNEIQFNQLDWSN